MQGDLRTAFAITITQEVVKSQVATLVFTYWKRII